MVVDWALFRFCDSLSHIIIVGVVFAQAVFAVCSSITRDGVRYQASTRRQTCCGPGIIVQKNGAVSLFGLTILAICGTI